MVTQAMFPDPISHVRSYDFRDLCKLVYNLKPTEIDMYLHLLSNPLTPVEEIARSLDRERSGVNRVISRLEKKALVVRHFRIGKRGGFTYLCEARDLEEMKKEMRKAVEDLARHAHTLLSGLWAEDLVAAA